MRRHFLLDENILYHAIKGVNEHNEFDLASLELVVKIAANCHSIILNAFLEARYNSHLNQLRTDRSTILQPLFFVNTFMKNRAKTVWQDAPLPRIPNSCEIPAEDTDIVRSALVTHPVVVSNDEDLREAINGCEALNLRALSARDALELANEPCTEAE
jgi:hypothetical protein